MGILRWRINDVSCCLVSLLTLPMGAFASITWWTAWAWLTISIVGRADGGEMGLVGSNFANARDQYSVHKPGYTLLRGTSSMTVTSFEATPLVGKSAVYSVDLASSKVSTIAGTTSIDWPNVPVPVPSD